MTNQVELRSVEEFMNDFTPTYPPIIGMFLDGLTQVHSAYAGNVDFKRLEAVGDLRAKFYGPKDTEMHQIAARRTKKSFLKYFFGAKFIHSNLQDSEGVETVNAQVLDEHNKQYDELFLLGEGTSNETVLNSGLYWSADANYTLEASTSLVSTGGHLPALYTAVANAVQKADDASEGQKVVLFYGSVMSGKVNALFSETNTPFMEVLGKGLPGVNFAKIPTSIIPSGANGFIVVNMNKVKTHYIKVPGIAGQGINNEEMYAWTNFLISSIMLEVLAKDGVIRQPVTFA